MRAGSPADWLQPAWGDPRIGALMTTRAGGASLGRFDSMNLRAGVGDDPAHVAQNQALLADTIGAAPVWLHQVHGCEVVRLGAAGTASDDMPHVADASVTSEPGIVCAVQVADCLPALFAAPNGAAVGAAHAGWRGLAAGVLEATLHAVCETGNCSPAEVRVWLGASIGPRRFEVGADVLAAFGARASPNRDGDDGGARFVPHAPGKWLANLPLLARDRLQAAGVSDITGGTWCTVDEPSRFFSFRRDGVTGRMAAAIWIERRG